MGRLRKQSVRGGCKCVSWRVWRNRQACVIRLYKDCRNAWELPRVKGGGLQRHGLQSDVLLAVNSVQPDEHRRGLNPQKKLADQKKKI